MFRSHHFSSRDSPLSSYFSVTASFAFSLSDLLTCDLKLGIYEVRTVGLIGKAFKLQVFSLDLASIEKELALITN